MVWDHIQFDRVLVPRVKHLMILQGVPLSHMFHERGMILLGCVTPPLWEAPFFLRKVVLAGLVTVNEKASAEIGIDIGVELLAQIRLDRVDH